MADVKDYIKKLVHPIAEIRERALNSLLQKVNFQLVASKGLSEHADLLPNLLKLLDLGPHTLRKGVIDLLRFVLTEETARHRFQSLGGIQYLSSLKMVAPLDIVPVISELIQKLQPCYIEEKSEDHIKQFPFRVPRATQVRFASANVAETSTSKDSSFASIIINNNQYIDQVEGNDNVDNSCLCENSEHELPQVTYKSPITYTTFPWQALTSSDRRVLDSTTQSLLSHHEAVVVAALHFLDTVVLKDFPPEVFLQRPAVVQAVYGCVEEEGENAWRVQGPACASLLTLTELLNMRVSHFMDPHLSPRSQQNMTPTSSGMATPCTDMTRGSCCSSLGDHSENIGKGDINIRHKGDGQDWSGSLDSIVHLSSTTVHEADDGDEFILLGMHQIPVTSHCVHIMNVICPLLVSPRPAIQTASLRLLLSCLKLLEHCLEPESLWQSDSDEHDILEAVGGIRRVIRSIAHLLIATFEWRNNARLSADLEKYVTDTNCLGLLLSNIFKIFVPLEASCQVIDHDVAKSLVSVLCDGGFYIEYSKHHAYLLSHLSKAEPTLAKQVKSITFAAQGLCATSDFLRTSTSHLAQFLELAERSLPVASIHQSTVFVEKLVRGLAKQIALGNVDAEQLTRMRQLLLQVLSYPDDVLRSAGFNCVLKLVEGSIGISQVGDTSLSRSARISILLSPSVIRFLLFSGLVDENDEVVQVTKAILLALFRGKLLMSQTVWGSAVECWRECLLDMQILADADTNLGRAVANLPADIYGHNRTEENFKILKFHLQCLYSKDREIRVQALSHVVHRLAAEITVFVPDPREFHLMTHQDLLINSQPIHLLLKGRISTETGRLAKVVELVMSAGESEVRRAAWSQLAFFLEDPALHQPFLQLCSIQYIVMNFVGMLKYEEALDLTVECIPGAVDVLRLLATHSQDIRQTLARNEELLLCLVRAAHIYYAEERIRGQASCLMALLLFDEIIQLDNIQNRKENEKIIGGKDFIMVPELLPTRLHLPFLCSTYPWHEEQGFCEEVRTLYQVLQEEDWEVMNLLKSVWASVCAGGLENLDGEPGQSANFSDNLQLTTSNVVMLRSSVLKLVISKHLQNTENATSHHEVKKNVNALSFSLLQNRLLWSDTPDCLSTHDWSQSLNRFITGRPNSTVDEQLLTHVLNATSMALMIGGSSQENGNSKFPLLVKLLMNELVNQESALHQTLRVTGAANWVASDPNPRALLSVRLFRTITNLVRQTLKYISGNPSLQDTDEEFSFDKLVESVTTALLPVLKSNDELQNYNLAVLGCTVECVAHVTNTGWPGEEIACQLARGLIRLISTFHVGRGRAHNSYMGRMVTLSSSLALIHLLSHPSGSLTQDIGSWSVEEQGDWSWLVSLWVYRDPVVTSTGLTVATALTIQPQGSKLLHESLTQVSGGVWGAALSYLLASGRSCLVRTLAAQLLINLTEEEPTANSPWRFPVVSDTLTGGSVEGVPALMVLLKHCNFFSVMYLSMAKLWIYQEQPIGNTHDTPNAAWDLSLSRLSSFCAPVSTDDLGASQSEVGSEDYNHNTPSLVSLQLYETLLRLLNNILLLRPSQVILELTSHGIISLVVKQLRYVVSLIQTSEVHLKVVETAMIFLCTVLKYDPTQVLPLARDTSLGHLTLVVLSSGLENTSICMVCLEVLTSLVWAGDWGAAHILEWISLSPVHTLQPVVASLHSTAPLGLQAAAASFVSSLLASVYSSDVTAHHDQEATLANILDVPVRLLNDQDVSPGWELCRHLIQLVCDENEIKDTASNTTTKLKGSHNPEHQHLLLECLKLLLLASEGAREAAHHLRLSFIPFLMRPLSQLTNKIQDINIHITTQLMNKKEIKEDAFLAIQYLEVANNWVKGRGRWIETVGEVLVPLLHQLWTPALRTPPLLTAMLTFMVTASAHHQACLFLTRTSGLPGVALSATRTSRPLLACVTTLVYQQLARLPNYTRGSHIGFKDLPKERFIQAISLLTNCARLQECTLIMNKCDLVSALMKWLDSKQALEDGMTVTGSIVKLMVVLTTHQEVQMSVCKTYGWVGTLRDLILQPSLKIEALLIAANLSRNHLCAQALLSSEDMLKTFTDIIARMEEERESVPVLFILWGLVANNQRGQAILKQYPVLPLLRHLRETQKEHASLCQKILNVLDR
ncbi:rotatin [Penaeus vannamei]|uniref:rotatin n=1 Tax=Penaeus vannamei TaxID=6689 RepID=UPI00387F9D81